MPADLKPERPERRFTLLMALLLPFLSGCLFDPEPFDEKAWRHEVFSADSADLYAPHQKGGVFFNPWMPEQEGRFFDFLKWRLSVSTPYSNEAEAFRPEYIDGLAARIQDLAPDDNFLVWVGHGTFLLRLDGSYWLTDPMLSPRALLPKRVTPPALSKADLTLLQGPINVIISHNHYDHLDEASIRALPERAVIYAPLGLGSYLEELHGGEVIELDWWQKSARQGPALTCLPAQHWSRRIWQGRNTTLWASFLLQSSDYTIYFGGDSGYFIGYREFGRLFPAIDYALLPTTAYQPRWFMHYPHMNAEEALAAFKDLQARYFVPTQWGSFRLGDNPPGYPLLDLRREIKQQGLEEERFILPGLGEIVMLEPAGERLAASLGRLQQSRAHQDGRALSGASPVRQRQETP